MPDDSVRASRPVILVVDDTPQHLSLISDMLEPDYTVKLANSGAHALRIAGSALPDLILLDIMMPEMDGYEVCRRLKSEPATSRIPVIFLTALLDAEDEQRGFDAGADDYITKPTDPTVVLTRIREALGKYRAP